MNSETEQAPLAVSHYAWTVVLLLFPVALLNYLDRQMLASMKFSIVGDIPSISNDKNWGTVLASFKFVYAALSPLGGYVADRFSRRHVICLSLMIWSAVTWGTAYVSTFEQMLIARALMGISEPGVEIGIALSAVVLGAAVWKEFRPPLGIAAALVGVFGLFHGHAHGTELPAGGDPLLYSIGFVVATGTLHAAGIGMGLVHRWPTGRILLRGAGAGIAVTGVVFLWQAIR